MARRRNRHLRRLVIAVFLLAAYSLALLSNFVDGTAWAWCFGVGLAFLHVACEEIWRGPSDTLNKTT
jgi:Na+/pantothenate symporter